MNSNKTWPYVALLFGIILIIIGAVLITGYVTEAYVARIGESDQSLLFWYLPFLIVGLVVFGTGLGVGVWGFIRLRKIKKKNSSKGNQGSQ